jgi:hypothetical protein
MWWGEFDLEHIDLYTAIFMYIVGADTQLGKMYIVLSDHIERRLRLAVVMRLGGKKGDLSGAIEEAVNDWLKKDSTPRH